MLLVEVALSRRSRPLATPVVTVSEAAASFADCCGAPASTGVGDIMAAEMAVVARRSEITRNLELV
ncbi:hypothetical protein [Sphingomonas phyllosphaerae]|uniref:hypothetical protein n=1 Tax=Sphingomonas phyllosphaerae TaxID=257003 RepID=UPI001E5762B6|nr:hypothetical protein [Sphingomonas phyllosphaerae]